MRRPGAKSKPSKPIDESRSKRIINHEYGTEEQNFHARGVRGEYSRIFYKHDGSINLELTVAQALLDKETPSDTHMLLHGRAEDLIKASGEKTLFEFYDELENEDFGKYYSHKYTILAAIWSGNIAEKYGLVSPEAIAAQFITASAEIIRRCGQETSLAAAVFSLCKSWHLWRSETFGEHDALFHAEISKSNLNKAGVARTKGKEIRLEIVREEASAFWITKPNYSSNASSTASEIHENVNRRLTEGGAGTYTLGSLVKAVGKLIKSNKALAT